MREIFPIEMAFISFDHAFIWETIKNVINKLIEPFFIFAILCQWTLRNQAQWLSFTLEIWIVPGGKKKKTKWNCYLDFWRAASGLGNVTMCLEGWLNSTSIFWLPVETKILCWVGHCMLDGNEDEDWLHG